MDFRDVLKAGTPGGFAPGQIPEPTERPCSGGCGATVIAPGPAWCRPCAAKADAADEAKRAMTELAPALESIPVTWRWASFDAPDLLAERTQTLGLMTPTMQAFPWRSGVTIIGSGGRGKTSLAAAIFREWVLRARESLDTRRIAKFIAARMLPLAKAEHGQNRGGADYVIAMHAPFVVLDDVGAEGDTPAARAAVSDVLAERHAWERPTIVTTWLGEAAMRQRYGDGIARRLFERALILDLGGAS